MPPKVDPDKLKELYQIHSLETLALELGTSKSTARRMLLRAGIQPRSKSEAQKLALEEGRADHPSEGKTLSEETKTRIGEANAARWEELSEEEKVARAARSRDAWFERPEAERKLTHQKAVDGLLHAAKHGSKIERFIAEQLMGMGYKVYMHQKLAVLGENYHVDIVIPEKRVVVEVDGPMHRDIVWDSETLRKKQEQDSLKNGQLMSSGWRILRIKWTARNATKVQCRKLWEGILPALKKFMCSRDKLREVGNGT